MIQMRQIVWKKLRAERGASITMAMLLFLACAVIGAVVLNAGTASAGRLSDMAETDRRYYSVASAAELVAKKLNGRSVIFEEIDTDGDSSLIVDGVAVIDPDDLDDLPLLAAHTVHYANHEHGMTEEMDLDFPELEENGYPATTIHLSSELDDEWRLVIELSDEGGFTLTLTMNPATVLLGDWTETDEETHKTTTTKITKISWSIADIQ